MSQSERGVGFIFPVPQISIANKSCFSYFFSFVFLPRFPCARPAHPPARFIERELGFLLIIPT